MSMLELGLTGQPERSGHCVPCAVSDFSLAALAALFLIACVGTVALSAVLAVAPPPIHGFTSPLP
jgi:hypothetical protein